MKPEAKLERKIVRMLGKFLADEGGVCLGLGLWFSTFVDQWPAVRQFIDADRVRQRSLQLEAQVPKQLRLV